MPSVGGELDFLLSNGRQIEENAVEELGFVVIRATLKQKN